MRVIYGVALGTYFAVNAEGGRSSANAHAMRMLVWLLKNNRPTPIKPELIRHPRYGAGAVRVSVQSAPCYVAEILAANRAKVLRQIVLPVDIEPCLVPIPSSTVTAPTIQSDRWPAYRIALQLEGEGFGKALPLVVNKTVSKSKTDGAHKSAGELLRGYASVNEVPEDRPIVLVDDVVTHGTHVAAIDQFLKQPSTIGMVVAAQTDSAAVRDCYDTRRFSVRYDEEQPKERLTSFVVTELALAATPKHK